MVRFAITIRQIAKLSKNDQSHSVFTQRSYNLCKSELLFYFIIAGLPFYDPSKDFTCLDGSRTIPFSSVNDDYCDCTDGSDEPGQHSHLFVPLSCNLQNYGTITVIYHCHLFIKSMLSSLSCL